MLRSYTLSSEDILLSVKVVAAMPSFKLELLEATGKFDFFDFDTRKQETAVLRLASLV